jgi:hypothetical protein
VSIKDKLVDGLTASFARVQQNRVEVCDGEACINRCKENTEGEKAFAAAAATNYVAAQITQQLSEMPAGEDPEKSDANQPDGKQSETPAGEDAEKSAANQPDGKQRCSPAGEEMEREAVQVASLIAVTGKTELERVEAANQPDEKPRRNHIYVCL